MITAEFIILFFEFNNFNSIIMNWDIMKKNDKYNNLTLKIDIEGGEYRVLHDIIKYKNKIKNLIIEFHEVDLNLQKIVDFIKQFKKYFIDASLNLCFFLPSSFKTTNLFIGTTKINYPIKFILKYSS